MVHQRSEEIDVTLTRHDLWDGEGFFVMELIVKLVRNLKLTSIVNDLVAEVSLCVGGWAV